MFKLVRESLQPQHFQRGLDPKHAMGIGKYAKIKAWLDEMEVKNYTINDDYTIDVDGNVWLYDKNLDKFPDYIQFGKVVNGYFDCSNNWLTSLKGCPKYVNKTFYCSYNQLTTLEGAPMRVDKNFGCSHNNLTSLEGAPKFVRCNFLCDDNHLTTLEGAPKFVGWNFFCYNNTKKFTVAEVRSVCKVKGSVYV